MARNVSFVFTLSMIISYFLLLGLVGESGYLHARSRKEAIMELEKRQQALAQQVEALQKQSTHMSSQDALKDAAFRLGYKEEGEVVYYFSETEETNDLSAQVPTEKDREKRVFKGLSKLWIVLIALVFSSVFTVVWATITKRRAKDA